MKCRMVRFRLEGRLEEPRTLPPSLERHLRECPGCDAWFRVHSDLIRRLRQAATEETAPEPPPFLRAKILRAVDEAPRPRAAWREWWTLPLPQTGAALATAAVVALAVFHFQQDEPPVQPKPGTAKSAAAPGSETPVSSSRLFPEVADGRELWQTAARLEHPLQREMTLLKEDALTALNALREGLVPENLIEEWQRRRG